jgi:hypothetical protein
MVFGMFGMAVVAAAGSVFSANRCAAQACESAGTLARGAWRADVDAYSWSRDRRVAGEATGGALREELWGDLQLAVGLTHRVEARIAWQAYRRSRFAGEGEEGAGDVWLSAKIGLAGDETEGAAWALVPALKLPTAGTRWADDTVDAGVLLVFGRPLGESGFFNAQLGGEDYGDGAGGRDRGASAAVVAGRAMGDRLTIYAEGLAELYPWNGDKARDDLAGWLGGGVAWSPHPEQRWGADLAAYAGLTRAASDARAVLRFWVEWPASGGEAR